MLDFNQPEVIPEGETATSYLRRLAYEGAGHRWPAGMPAKVQTQIAHELTLIAEVGYGGDEFMAMVDRKRRAEELAKQVRAAVASQFCAE